MAQDYDWRGIAMLTQQMGQLFEPSKHKLLDKQQEHEMNMLMAKQAWTTQVKQVDQLEEEYNGLAEKIQAQTGALNKMGLNDLVTAGMSDGSLPDAASEVHNKLDVKKLSDMQELANKYRDMITERKNNLANMKLYNETAKAGESWSKSMTAKTTEEREDIIGKDYKSLHDDDKSGTLSWSEQDNALKSYIKDYYSVPEGQEGMEITIGEETFQATPEAHAFVAGFRNMSSRKSVDATEAALQANKLKTNTAEKHLDVMYKAHKTIQDFEQQGLSSEVLGDVLKGEIPEGFTSSQVNQFLASNSLYKEAYKGFIKKGGILPDDLIGVAPVSPNMFTEDTGLLGRDEDKDFSAEGLNYEKYIEIQQGKNETYKKIAFNIIYNWDDVMDAASKPKATKEEKAKKTNILKTFENLKQAYNF